MHLRNLALLSAMTMIVVPLAAQAQAVTYDFTGTVTESSGGYSSATVGSEISGTYTFDYANANPVQSGGTVGSMNFESYSYGGHDVSGFGTVEYPEPTSYVFSSTATFGTTSYVTSAPDSFFTISRVTGTTGGTLLFGGEQVETANLHSTLSDFSLTGTSPVYSADGLPKTFTSGSAALDEGDIFVMDNSIVTSGLTYHIDTLTIAAVPEPADAWLLLSGVGSIGVIVGRRRKQTMPVFA